MKNIVKVLVFTTLLAVLMGTSLQSAQARGKFTLKSTTIKEGMFLEEEQVFNGYGCTGRNVSPDLQWFNPPKGTQSYVLIMHDPDAPTKDGWYHWVISNIPSVKKGFQKGEVLAYPIIQSTTSFDTNVYGGPCPPLNHGRHRYIFTLYALSTKKLATRPEFMPQYIEAVMKPHILGEASITTYYERK